MSPRTNDNAQVIRKSFACDECKRRKIRCTGGDRCSSCARDARLCRYSSPSQKLVSLQRRLRESEAIRCRIARAWSTYLPDVDLQTALQRQTASETGATDGDHTLHLGNGGGDALLRDETVDEQDPGSGSGSGESLVALTEERNAEDYEFDESQDADGQSIDGMGFLTADPHKAGYTGPPSGIAALRFLRSLQPNLPLVSSSASYSPRMDDPELPDASSQSPETISLFIDQYFQLYHPAYPILHEGTFRARISGALAKPRDGSWPLLYNTVLTIGGFVGDSYMTNCDIPFFREARKHLTMNIIEKGSLSYVQALVLFANYLQKRNKPNAGLILIGTAFNMALAIGLHREFDAATTPPFIMEVRRRVWWTLFVFVSGAQLSLGRPAASLMGVNITLPSNLDDPDLVVDMDQVPPSKETPTVSSCLIAQIKLAKIANSVQEELHATSSKPTPQKAAKLEERIQSWMADLPTYFDQSVILTPRIELPKRVLLWRSFNLRIILNRPFFFEAIARASIPHNSNNNNTPSFSLSAPGPVARCLAAADECVASICGFLHSTELTPKRGFAWYATAWLITASLVQATCLIHSPDHTSAGSWRTSIEQAIVCLQSLGVTQEIAIQALDILKSVLEFHTEQGCNPDPSIDDILSAISRTWQQGEIELGSATTLPAGGVAGDGGSSWLTQDHSSHTEPFETAGGLMFNDLFRL